MGTRWSHFKAVHHDHVHGHGHGHVDDDDLVVGHGAGHHRDQDDEGANAAPRQSPDPCPLGGRWL